ncbi:MAG: phosphoenolpyruvate--protein phosphotransferase [Chloroflexi bacterium]|nr:phosphoenolpyruvate--protein phosphotransferase [Chloroflexota bacterium]
MTTRTFTGQAAAPGIASGPAVVYDPGIAPGAPGGEPAEELARLNAAIARVDTTIAAYEQRLRNQGKREEAEIFAAHRVLLRDPALRDRAAALVVEAGRPAADAFSTAAEEQASELEQLDHVYLSARAADIRDVARQVRHVLTGSRGLVEQLTTPAVVIARELGPSELMNAPRSLLQGFALAAGGLTSHTCILARGLGIPAVVGLGDAILHAAASARIVALDGDTGTLTLDPTAALLAQVQARQRDLKTRAATLRSAPRGPVHTRDGRRVRLLANVATPAEAHAARAWGAEGIGLLRTELLFLERPDLPDEAEQLALYHAIAAELPGLPITVRTLDVGGDKHLPALPLPAEANPFLGWRGIRIGLSRPEILLPQLRALLRAGAEADIRILLPMITSVAELRQVRALLDEARRQLVAAGQRHCATVQIGVMIEVPAAALNAEALARDADFFSIGTNDLTQYTLACDRGNSQVAELYQPLDPAVLRLIAMACAAAHRHGRPVTLCGELGGAPGVTALLIGLGIDELSCAPAALAAVRAAVQATDSARARAIAEQALAAESAAQVRALLPTVA